MAVIFPPAGPILASELMGELFGVVSGINPGLWALLLGFAVVVVIRLMMAAGSTPDRRFYLAPVLALLVAGMAFMIWLADLDRGNMAGHKEARQRMQCVGKLKQIGLAMHNYHDEYGCLPPAYVANENGEPLYSWRVLLLPFLSQHRNFRTEKGQGSRQLYEQFRLDEPWDSPHNLTLLEKMPVPEGMPGDLSYQCSAERGGQDTETDYVMIVGADTISDGPGCRSFREIRDGTSNTVAIVEVVDSGIQWTEPTRSEGRRDQLPHQRS